MKQRTKMIKQGLGITDKLKLGFICFSQLKIDKKFDLLAIERVIEKYKPKLLIVDTYRRGISFDENDAGAVSKLFVDLLRPLCEQNNLSILLIHHNGKGGRNTNDEMDELRGSSDLANYADMILKLERKAGGLLLKQLKNRNMEELKPFKINMKFQDNFIKFDYGGEYEKTTKIDKCTESLIIWFNENNITQFKTKEAQDIAFTKGFKKQNFYNSLQELQDNGIIEKLEFGIYEVIK